MVDPWPVSDISGEEVRSPSSSVAEIGLTVILSRKAPGPVARTMVIAMCPTIFVRRGFQAVEAATRKAGVIIFRSAVATGKAGILKRVAGVMTESVSPR